MTTSNKVNININGVQAFHYKRTKKIRSSFVTELELQYAYGRQDIPYF